MSQLINTNNPETFPCSSLQVDMKGESATEMSAEEERDYYKKRFQSLKMVLKEVQQQLSQYKNRCLGVDTVTLLLKESKQEVVRLNKHCKVLESAVVNLQNRLTTNGLSNSINIEETELFVPGASKQTLDNLAKENARLRSLLKGTENQPGRKPSEDIHGLKLQLEKLESENAKLKAQNDHVLAQGKEQFEANNFLRVQNMQHSSENVKISDVKTKSDVEHTDQGTQTAEVAPTLLEKLKDSLKLVTDQCSELATQLDKAQTLNVSEGDSVDNRCVEKNQRNEDAQSELLAKELVEWKRKYEQVVVMNQRWQQHNDTQERQIAAYTARIAELNDPEAIRVLVSEATASSKKEATTLKAQVNAVGRENEELKRRIDFLNQEIAQQRNQPPFDVSIVEILKQQIQACTEDFNSERRDREEAVRRAEQLQHELSSLKVQKEKLQADFESLKQVKSPSFTPQRRETMSPVRTGNASPNSPTPPFRARGPATLPGTNPDRLFAQYATHQAIRQATPSIARDGPGGNYAIHEAHTAGSEFLSLQRPALDFDMLPELGPMRGHPNTSMPVLSANKPRAGTGELSCPKCDTQFLEGQSEELIKHMDNCTD